MRPHESAPGYDDPLGLLAACHRRIENQCVLLHKLVAHLGANGSDAAAREAASGIMRYFDTAGRHHHEDEEHDLFPVLARHAPALAPQVNALAAEHARMEAVWQRLRAALAQIAQGAPALDGATVDEFTALYRAHIEREERDIFPTARQHLTPGELQTLALGMAQRRGIRLTD